MPRKRKPKTEPVRSIEGDVVAYILLNPKGGCDWQFAGASPEEVGSPDTAMLNEVERMRMLADPFPFDEQGRCRVLMWSL